MEPLNENKASHEVITKYVVSSSEPVSFGMRLN